MSPQKQRDYFVDNGFLVIPKALTPQELKDIHSEIEGYGLTGTTEDIWKGSSILPLIENRKVLTALQAIFGEEVRFFKGAYAEYPGTNGAGATPQRKALHHDYGIGERIGDYRNSCASWVNVGFYLTDLTPEHGPFWVVPGSNHRYYLSPESHLEYMDDEARMILASAGDAILFHCLTVHATSLNVSDRPRQALFFSYRPAWARPVGTVPEWPVEFIEQAPPERRKLLVGLNKGL
jgi:ectoine hydroxylase-related dioxygenase (phytanoyl-CoA dioxygenase family)